MMPPSGIHDARCLYDGRRHRIGGRRYLQIWRHHTVINAHEPHFKARKNQTITCEPGARLLDVQAAASAEGLFYPPDPGEKIVSIGGTVITNAGGMILAIVGLLVVAFVPELVGAPIPMLVLVQNSVGASVLTPIISILMILGAVSTGVNMVSGIVVRCANAVKRRISGHQLRNIAFSVLFTGIAFALAQLGLMAVVKKGYAYLGYAGLISVFIPFVIHFIADISKKEKR
ncbi:MAG: FAD-binding protein [Candidatus Fimivivens sp.]